MTMKNSNQAGARSARKPLAGSFEAVFWRVASDPAGAHSRVLAVLVSALASLQPAWRAARMDPIQALRHV